jgi:para-aminobenzoate synthetase/4-amino-4-deoxychorismate lyase
LSIRFAHFPESCYPTLARSPHSILLQSSRCDAENYRSHLFLEPSEVITAESPEELGTLFARIEDALARGNFVAGFFSYECGSYECGERAAAASTNPHGMPLAWFGVYPRACIFNHHSGSFEGEPPRLSQSSQCGDLQYAISNARLEISEDVYSAKVDAIHEYIRSGETYQVNLTDRFTFDFSGSPMGLFAAINASQPVPYSAFINLGERQILSFSPELFFRTSGRTSGRRIVTRPMKGTARRGRTLEEDAAIAEWLRTDPKNRSENVMIVDLLRNDIGRICEFGSVRVEELFAVESYDTLFQMVSTVSGELRPETGLFDIFQSIFPCGSVTGAPKIRTMEVIRRLEQRRRGVYTGAIGFFAPGGESVFNVAIRTVLLSEGRGEMGVGSGITIDSVAQEEYRECCLKANFLTSPTPAFLLIETLLWDGERYPLLDLHLQRLEGSARYFGFAFDPEEARTLLAENARRIPAGISKKVRLTLNRQGTIKVENTELGRMEESGRVAISPVRTSSLNRFLYHKTTQRQHYAALFDKAQQEGYDDILFFNERGELTEGAISNVFVEIEGKLLTPPISCGLLTGVYRQHLLVTDARAAEQVLTLQELLSAESVYLCNAVRGMRKVSIVL